MPLVIEGELLLAVDLFIRGGSRTFVTILCAITLKSKFLNFTEETNSADPDEMQHSAAFHLGLHCLPKYPFRDFP